MTGRGRPRKVASRDSLEQGGAEAASVPKGEEEKEEKARKGKQRKPRQTKQTTPGASFRQTPPSTLTAEGTMCSSRSDPAGGTPNRRMSAPKAMQEQSAALHRKASEPKDDASLPVTSMTGKTAPQKKAPKKRSVTPKKTRTSQQSADCEKGKAQPEPKKQEIPPNHGVGGKDQANALLQKTLRSLTIRMQATSAAAQVINEITDDIVAHLKKNTQSFKEIGSPLCTGSYYEKVKISLPDEFDVMIPVPVERVGLEVFGDDGAFYRVALKRGASPLAKFQEDGTLCASKMLQEFREEVKKCVKDKRGWEVTKKRSGCPAVTLSTMVESMPISLDFVLCVMVKSSWPPFTADGLKIEHWLGTKVKQDFKRQPYYLVSKYRGSGTAEKDGVRAKDTWRISFSHVEKDMLMNHGSEKTCCERGGTPCCRKDCLKLLKYLLSLLKEKNAWLEKFCSYHAKTTLFHLCCSRTHDSDWRSSDLSVCFQKLLEAFQAHLESGRLQNFFIPTQNLLSDLESTKCKKLAALIRDEYQLGFPTFKQQILSA